MELPVLTIDLGGTKIMAAIVSKEGEVIAKEHYPTLAQEGPEAVIKRVVEAIDHILGRQETAPGVSSISIAAAGAIDSKRGVVTFSPNLPGWRDIPMGDVVRRKYGVRTFVINDANAAALGEHRFGAGRGASDLVLLTVGTGIGGGIIVEGKLYSGAAGSAGEIGHMTIEVNGPKCKCGNTGCLEVLASGTAIAREAIGRLNQGEKSALTEMVGSRMGDVTAEKVSLAAQAGDRLALEVIGKAANYLGVGMVNLVNILNPEVLIVGGGVGNMGELLLGPGRKLVKDRAFPVAAKAVRIVSAELGNDAGLLGAAVFANEQGLC